MKEQSKKEVRCVGLTAFALVKAWHPLFLFVLEYKNVAHVESTFFT